MAMTNDLRPTPRTRRPPTARYAFVVLGFVLLGVVLSGRSSGAHTNDQLHSPVRRPKMSGGEPTAASLGAAASGGGKAAAAHGAAAALKRDLPRSPPVPAVLLDREAPAVDYAPPPQSPAPSQAQAEAAPTAEAAAAARAAKLARKHARLKSTGDIDAVWLNKGELARLRTWWEAQPPPRHDAATVAALADLGACTTLQCVSAAGARLQGRTRFNIPHFFIIGWQKTGTTSVHAYLRHHPQLLFGRAKETHWFASCQKPSAGPSCKADNETHYLREALRVREAAAKGLEAATVDASADYARLGVTLAPRLRELFPWLKIVIMLRDPISRAISYTRMHTEQKHATKGCAPDESLYDCLLGVLGPGPRRQAYGKQLTAWLAAFPKDQVHVIQMEAMQEAPQAAVDRLKAFLGFDPSQPDRPLSNVNSRGSGRGAPMRRSEYKKLVNLARADMDRVTEALEKYGAGDGAAFAARWEAVWARTLGADCNVEGNCSVDSN